MSCSERRQGKYLELADEKVNQEEFAQASDILKRTITLNPESKPALKAMYKLGFILETYLKDHEGALFHYQEFVRMSKEPLTIYEVQKRIANIYFSFNYDPEKAITAYKKLIEFNRDSLEADLFQYRVAQSYFRKNDFTQARIEFQLLLDLYPKSQFVSKVRFDIANSYYMEAKYDVAIQALKLVYRKHPQSELAIESQFLIAQCLEHQNKLREALNLYESMKERYPSSAVLALKMKEVKKHLLIRR